ncbi:MAG TPA: Zn-ribbon domain-containing OB-fold protein [Anaerolineae bacterium]|nr:Zn-ribbon domain-containing OB-fold protein [Anaerolineae bacterium]
MDVPRHWRLKAQRYALIGEECPDCKHRIFPPRDVCPECGSPAYAPFAFSGRGEVYSYSTVYQAPATHEAQAPYTVALIRLEEGPLITAQLTDVDRDEVRIGLPVEMVTRVLQSNGERGMIVYGYKFRPVAA